MPNDEMENDLRAQWQSQAGDGGKMSVEEIRVEAQRLHDRWRKGNIREYRAAAITALIFLLEILFLNFPLPVRVALALFVLDCLYSFISSTKGPHLARCPQTWVRPVSIFTGGNSSVNATLCGASGLWSYRHSCPAVWF